MTSESNEQVHPLISRFELLSWEGVDSISSEPVIGEKEFLSLIRQEYNILCQRVSEMRSRMIHNTESKNIDRIDGVSQVLALLLSRAGRINALLSPVKDPLQIATNVPVTKVCECSCGDFTSIESEVQRHVAMMKTLEDSREHSVFTPVDTIEDLESVDLMNPRGE
jgi:hypothetical protein